VNFLVPPQIPSGRHQLSIGSATAEVLVTGVSPGIFTANGTGRGVPVAAVTTILNNGARFDANAFHCDIGGCEATPLPILEGIREMHFVLYMTGVRNVKAITASVGPIAAEVLYAGATSQFPGVDQVNLVIRNFTGLAGRQPLHIRADGFDANPVELSFR
jgi:uncharacterized protein (TIGR03437 family)